MGRKVLRVARTVAFVVAADRLLAAMPNALVRFVAKLPQADIDEGQNEPKKSVRH